MPYQFLVDTYETESIKVVSVWSEFRDDDLEVRPRCGDPRGRSMHEHMVRQCVSEDKWFRNMLGIDVAAPPLPREEARLAFMKRYAEDSAKRVDALRDKPDHAPTIYAYSTLDALFKGEAGGGAKRVLPEPSGKPLTERPTGPIGGHQPLS